MKNLTLKTLSVVLVLMMLLSVVPVAVLAANSLDASIIKSVEITGVHTPYAGYLPDYESRLGSTSYTYDDQLEDEPEVYNGKWWYDETEQKVVSPSDTFKVGHIYTFTILLMPEEGYEFRVDNYNTPFISATVNGEEARVYDDLTGKYQAFIEYTFEPCEYNYEITKVEVNVEEPVAGGHPKFDVEILTPGVSKDKPESPYCIESVAWYDCVNQTFLDPSHTFKEDGIYEVNIFLTTIGDYYFSTNNDMTDVKAIINGKEGISATAGKDDKYHIRVARVVFGDIREEVSYVEVTDVESPCVGSTADFDVTPVNDKFYINGVFWKDVTDNVYMKETDTFKAGHEYELQVWIRTNEDYKFSTDEDGYIDIMAIVGGEQADVTLSDSEISAELSVKYVPSLANVVSFVDVINVDAPVAGNTPDYDAFCTTPGCNVSKVQWYDVTEGRGVLMTEDDTFAPGRVYRVDVLVEAEGNHTFLMADGYNEAEGFINGEKAIAYGSHDETELELGLEFAPCEEAPATLPTESTAPTNTEATKPTETTETQPTETTVTDSTETKATEPTETKATEPTETTVTEPDASTSTDATEPTTSATGEETKPTVPSTTTTEDGTKPSEPVVDNGILGDVNGDGKVNIKDATQIQKFAAKLQDLTDTEKLRADVNADEKINIKDATAIQKYVAKIETGYPIGLPA